jgi:predicted Zn-dependent protease
VDESRTDYQSLIGLAKDADTWAIAAYQKAFVLDPTNPVLRINLGGLYLTLGRTDEAGQAFLTAILLKPNYLTGFYNLAEVFRQKGDFDNAIKALEQARILVLRGSADEAKLEEEIKALVAERRTKGQTQTPSGLVVPELKLPN